MRARRTDANHQTVRDSLRKLGFSVADTSRLGNGFPDLVIARHDITALVEVKDGKKSESRRQLNDLEFAFFKSWKGLYFIVANESDIERVVFVFDSERRIRMSSMTIRQVDNSSPYPASHYQRGYET